MIEGLSLARAEYALGGQISSQRGETLTTSLCEIDGVEGSEIHDDLISVQFYPDVISRDALRLELVRRGVIVEKAGKPHGAFRRFLDRMAESNAKNFGAEPLDCCKLNSKQRS